MPVRTGTYRTGKRESSADHIVKRAFVYRDQWRRGDVLLRDNCLVQHRAIPDYALPCGG